MILCFSGTGNSAYIARQIANATGDTIVDLNTKLKDNDTSALTSASPWVLVAPTYAWRIPTVIQDWLRKTPLGGTKDIYVVLTCGDSTGAASIHAKRFLTSVGLTYRGFATSIMPENYLAMFPVPPRDQARQMVVDATAHLKPTIDAIMAKADLPTEHVSTRDRLVGPIINRVFYRFKVKHQPFFTHATCDSCTRCATICPVGAIAIQDGKPFWNDKCTHCMACITHCHTEAIEYGKHSVGKDRYTLEKTMSE